MKITKLSVNRWLNKENVVNKYSGILFSLTKEGNPALLTTWINLKDIMPSETSCHRRTYNSTFVRCLDSETYRNRIEGGRERGK